MILSKLVSPENISHSPDSFVNIINGIIKINKVDLKTQSQKKNLLVTSFHSSTSLLMVPTVFWLLPYSPYPLSVLLMILIMSSLINNFPQGNKSNTIKIE